MTRKGAIAVVFGIILALLATVAVAESPPEKVYLPLVGEDIGTPPENLPSMQSESDDSCHMTYFDNLGWVEACVYRITVTTLNDVVRIGFCIDEPPFGGCSFPNADHFSGDRIVWNQSGVYAPQLYKLRTTDADLYSTSYLFNELECTGDCDWQRGGK